MEKEQFKNDPEGLETWLEELRMVARQSKVDKDVHLTSGTKLAKYIHRKKKLLLGAIQGMAHFDTHAIVFIACCRLDAHVAHAQNAILFGSPLVQQLAKSQFNLKKSLEELFVKLMHEQLDATGISKWHEEAEKKQRIQELKSRDSAYSAASKYLRNLFVSNGHAWFPVSVPWVRLLPLFRQHRLRIAGWPLEDECPAPHPRRTNKSWEGGHWRFLVTQFHKGNNCPIKVEKWGEQEADDDPLVPLIVDRDDHVVYRVRDVEPGASTIEKKSASTSRSKASSWNSHKAPASTSRSSPETTKSTRILSAPFIEDSNSDSGGIVNTTSLSSKPPSSLPSGLQTQDAMGMNPPQHASGSNSAVPVNWSLVDPSFGMGNLIPDGPLTSLFGAAAPMLSTSFLGTAIPAAPNSDFPFFTSTLDSMNLDLDGINISSIPSGQFHIWPPYHNTPNL